MWIHLIIILMVTTIGFSRAEWRWADDTAEFTMDKEAHLVGSFGLYYLFRHKEFNETQSILYSLSLGLIKETSDALLPWEEYGIIGGDGFSKYDLYYNIAGIGLAYALDKLWKTEKKNASIKCGFSRNTFVCSIRIP